MKLTAKLLAFLHRIFEKDPKSILAIQFSYDGEMNWSVADGTLTTTVSGGSGVPLSIDLSQYTIGDLAAHINAQPGYSVTQVTTEFSARQARMLLDSQGVQGEAIFGYTSMLWALIDAIASELTAAKQSIEAMPLQMVISTANDDWLEEWGTRFGIPRNEGEPSSTYAARLAAWIFRVKSNNLALEQIIEEQTGYTVEIIDIDWVFNKSMLHDRLGINDFAPGTPPDGGYPYYGPILNDNPLNCAFAVLIGVPDVGQIAAENVEYIRSIVRQYRAAGTVGKYFGPAGYFLRTNTSGETDNDLVYLVGPKTPSYREITL